MTTIITRAAKSSPLSSTEVDSNFVNLKTTADAALPKAGGALTGAVTTNSTIDGRDVATDGTKLDGIEANATADQTNAEIRTAVEAASDSNVFTDADHSKLNAIEASATADQTDAEIKTAYESNSDTNAFTDADHTKLDGIATNANNYVLPSGYATETYVNTQVTNLVDSSPATLNTLNELAAALGDDPNFATTTANSIGTKAALSGAAFTGAITTNSTIDGRDVATDGTKLDGIEASADVTDATNVTAAGALMDSEVTNLAQVKAFDSSDYATAAQGTTANAALPKSGGTLTGNLSLGDNVKAQFGASNDLQIYHDGNNSYIDEAGTGNLRIRGSQILLEKYTGETILQGVADGSVYIFHDNAEKLATTSTGIDVTGSVVADGLTVSGNITNTGNNYFADATSGYFFAGGGSFANGIYGYGTNNARIDTNSKIRINIASNGDISFYEDTGTTPKFFWDASAESLGIGDSNPSFRLDVNNTSSRVRFKAATGNSNLELSAIEGRDYVLQSLSDGKFRIYDEDASAERLTINADGSSVFSGSVTADGLTASTSGNQIMLLDSTNGAVTLQMRNGSGSINTFIKSGIGGSSNLKFETGSADALTLDASQNVNIPNGSLMVGSTTAPSYKLDVAGTLHAKVGSSAMLFDEYSNGATLFLDGSNGDFSGADYFNISAYGTTDLAFGYGTVTKMTLKNTGSVGIGTATFTGANSYMDDLVVYNATSGSGAGLSIIANATNGYSNIAFGDTADWDTGRIQYNHSDNSMALHVNSAERLRIDNQGRVGIGDDTFAAGKLRVYDTAGNHIWLKGRVSDGNASVSFRNNADNAYNGRIATDDTSMNFQVNGTERMRLNSDGSCRWTPDGTNHDMTLTSHGTLLVGKTSTSGSTSTAGHLMLAEGVAVHTRSGAAALRVSRIGSDGEIATFHTTGGTTVGSIGALGASLLIGNGDTGLRFAADNNAIHPWNTTSLGLRDAAIDLGADSIRFKDLYLSGSVSGGGTYRAGNTGTGNIIIEGGQHIFRYGSGGAYAERARIDTSGNLLVGKGASSFTLAGVEIQPSGRIELSRSGELMNLNRLGSDGSLMRFYGSSALVGSIGARGGDVYLETGSVGLRMYDAGGSIIPVGDTGVSKDNSIDLGEPTIRFKDLYLSGTLNGDKYGIHTEGGGSLYQTNGYLRFANGNTETARIDSSGNLLVGTSNTTWQTQEGLRYFNGSSLIVTRDSDEPMSLNRLTNDGDLLILRKDGTSVGSIGTHTSNMFIGSVDSGLYFDSTNNRISPYYVNNNSLPNGGISLGGNGNRFQDLYLSGTANASELLVQKDIAGSPTRIKISNNGTVQSGTAIRLSFYEGTSEKSYIERRRDGSGKTAFVTPADDNPFVFESSGSLGEFARFTGGNLLVGKTATSQTTAGTVLYSNGQIYSTASGTQASVLTRLSNDGPIQIFYKDSSEVGRIGVTGSGVEFYIDGAYNVNRSGLELGYQAILPRLGQANANGTVNLGNSGRRFKDLHLSGGVYLGGTGSANHLDDYEEGTWFPTFSEQTAGTGTYTKIGRFVQVWGEVVCDANGAGVNPLTLSGLPFGAIVSGSYRIHLGFDSMNASASGSNAPTPFNGMMLMQHDQYVRPSSTGSNPYYKTNLLKIGTRVYISGQFETTQ